MSYLIESNEILALGLQELEDGGKCFARAFASELKPAAIKTVSEWADENRIVSQKGSSEPGSWRTDRTPYLREIMDELSENSSATDIVFKKGTQVGGTECGLNWIGYIIDYVPGPTMIIWPTSNTGKRNSKQRLTPLIDESPVLSKRISKARSRDSGNTTMMKEFAGGVLVVAGANSAAELKSMPIKNLFADEIDEYPRDVDNQGDPIELAKKRTSNFPRKKRLYVSSPTVEGFSRIDDLWKESDQRRFYVPCPECKKTQWLKFGQMRWELRKTLEYICFKCGMVSDGELVGGDSHCCPECHIEDKINKHNLVEKETDELIRVWYECEHCESQISEHHKTPMLDAGEWIAENAGPDRAAGFHLSSLYSPIGWYSWREAVKDHLKALVNEILKKVFRNTVEAETYIDESAETPDTEEVKDLTEAYRPGIVPDGGLLLIASVDVQANRLEVKLKAWGRNEESWLVEYHVIYGDPDDDDTWKSLDDYLLKHFPHEHGSELRIAATGIDSGYKSQRVYDFCRKRARRHVIALKGMPGDGRPILGSPTQQDINFKGKKIKKGVKLWPVGTFTAKSLIYGRLKKRFDDEGVEISRDDQMHFPKVGLPEDYFEQLTVERVVTFYDKTGQARRAWCKKPNDRNEAFDLEVYNNATAIYAGVKRKNWDAIEEKLNIVQRDLFNQKQTEQVESSADDDESGMTETKNDALVATDKKTNKKNTQRKKRPRKNATTNW